MNDLTKINFHGDEILIATDESGQMLIPLKRISDNIGNRWDAELIRIKNDEILNEGIQKFCIPSPNNGGQQEMICLPLEMLNGYLFSIPITDRTPKEVKPRLLQYKRECYKVLYNHFTKKAALSSDPSERLIKNFRIVCKEYAALKEKQKIMDKSFELILTGFEKAGMKLITQEKESKPYSKLCPEFVETMENLEFGQEYNKDEIYKKFIQFYYNASPTNKLHIYKHTFTRWLKRYADKTGLAYKERASHGRCFFSINLKTDRPTALVPLKKMEQLHITHLT